MTPSKKFPLPSGMFEDKFVLNFPKEPVPKDIELPASAGFFVIIFMTPPIDAPANLAGTYPRYTSMRSTLSTGIADKSTAASLPRFIRVPSTKTETSAAVLPRTDATV